MEHLLNAFCRRAIATSAGTVEAAAEYNIGKASERVTYIQLSTMSPALPSGGSA